MPLHGWISKALYCVKKKPISKEYIVYDSIYMEFGKGKIIEIENRSMDTSNWIRSRRRLQLLEGVFWVMKQFCILIVLVVIQICTCVKTHRTVHTHNTIIYNYTSIKMAKRQKTENTKHWQEYAAIGFLIYYRWDTHL